MQSCLEQKGKSVAPLQNSGGKSPTTSPGWVIKGKTMQSRREVDTEAQQSALPGTGALTWDLPRSHLQLGLGQVTSQF